MMNLTQTCTRCNRNQNIEFYTSQHKRGYLKTCIFCRKTSNTKENQILVTNETSQTCTKCLRLLDKSNFKSLKTNGETKTCINCRSNRNSVKKCEHDKCVQFNIS